MVRMAPKSTVWMFGGFQRVFLVYLLVCGLMVSAADEGTVYLDQKEAYVRSIASSAETNQRTCGMFDLGLCFNWDSSIESILWRVSFFIL